MFTLENFCCRVHGFYEWFLPMLYRVSTAPEKGAESYELFSLVWAKKEFGRATSEECTAVA
jgi:hypothetical protein